MMMRVLVLILALCAATASPAQRVTSLSIATPWLGLPQVDVTLNGTIDARFIVDTAASETILTDETIARLGLAGRGEPAELAGATGNSAIEYFELASLRLGAREYRRLGAYSFPRLAAPVEADGLIGADILRQHVVEFDLPGQRLRLFDRRADFLRGASGWMVVPFHERADGLLIVPVSVGRVRMPALFDTGAVQNIVNREAARRLGLRLFPDSDSREAITGASGHVQDMNQIEISRFRIGDMGFGNSRVGITDLAVFDTLEIGRGPAMLLSADVLADRRFIIDYPRNRLLIARDPS
ncbi:aspartyl protease family protein [Parasphingopyxis sp.]|uniref:aspartyl protease family protein n=1 Tax=Parasphingopyxis sp. TaxID=1920299 RepID=UPI003FA08130